MRPGLVGAAAAADPEAVVGPRQAELREEDAGHRLVVVLAGVDEDLVVARPQHRLQRGGLDELRPRPDDGDDAHVGAGRGSHGTAVTVPPRADRAGDLGLHADALVADAVRAARGRAASSGRRRPARRPGNHAKSRSRNAGRAVWVTIARTSDARRPRATASRQRARSRRRSAAGRTRARARRGTRAARSAAAPASRPAP